jgi:predicted metal-dependent phosphoesterase TrpH
MKYDLHIHSNITDGKHSRNEIIEIAKSKKLEYIAFTEHNTYVETKSDDIYIVSGIEFDVKFERSFHLLCYFPKMTIEIEKLLNKYRENTSESTKKLVENIRNHFNIDGFNYDVIPSKNGYKTKRDVITWLLNNSYATTADEASEIFTGKKAVSYVPKYSLTFEEVANCIHESNGFVILAHPESLKLDNLELDNFIKQLVKKELDGIEVLNLSKNNRNMEQYYLYLANKYNLITSSGSDFHNILKHKIGLENEYSDELLNLLYKKQKKL